ncbi:MAG: MaoC/PaaZ C-terminal domain-containing protein [Deltaproteobacteria bacterium]|nr:MaoC/PaaZ C-terminal domain-containing protein [Deltaproteobacteria bacterium]
MPQLYWDTIELGDPVTPLSKPAVTRVQIAKFAGASQDWSPLHIDDDFAKSAGYGSVFAHGATSLGFAIEAVQKWLENGRVLMSTSTFQKLVWPGDILTAKGVVVNRYEKNGEPRIDVDVWAENQNHDIVMKGQVTCLLWKNEKEGKKTKNAFPSVSAETIKERRTSKPVPKNDAEATRARLEAAALQQQQHAVELKKGARPAPRPAAPPPPPPAARPAPSLPVRPAVPAKPPPSRPSESPPAAKPVKPTAPPAKPTAPAKPVAKPTTQPPKAAKPVKPAKPAKPVKAAKPPPPAKKPAPPAKKPAPKPVAKKPAPPAKKPAPKPAKKKK